VSQARARRGGQGRKAPSTAGAREMSWAEHTRVQEATSGAGMGGRLFGARGMAADTRGSHPDDSLVRPPDVDPPRMARALMGLR
jgi:hypothetical protein